MLIKRKFYILFCLSSLLFFSITNCSAATKITYIGSAGYLLESNKTKILIDVPFSDFVKKFEVPIATQVTQDRIASAEQPFNDVDIILITHSHPGHFDHSVLAGFLKNSPRTKLVSTPVVIKILESESPDFASFKSQIVIPELPTNYDATRVVIDRQVIRVSRAPHWTRPDTTDEGYIFNYAFNLNGVEILYALAQDKYVKTSDIDVLFGSAIETNLEPKHIVLTHQSKYENIANLARETSTMPNVTFLSATLQNALLTKQKDGTFLAQ